MATALTQNLNSNQKIRLHVELKGFDGSTPDTTTPLVLTQPPGGFATLSVDPANPRQVIVTGNAVGVGNGSISASSVPSGNGCTVPVSVTAPPNLARVDFLSADPPEPK